MARRLIITFLIFLACSSIYTVNSQSSSSESMEVNSIYKIDQSKCVFPFTYNGQTYHNCTTDGSNGDIAWCSVEPVYNGVFAYCYDMRVPNIQCLPTYTINGKSFKGCDYLTKTAPYKQCKTNNPNFPYLYCPNVTNSQYTGSFNYNLTCNYSSLSTQHTKCYNPSAFAVEVPITKAQKQALLDIHASYRNAVPAAYMFEMQWHDELAALAQGRSNLCGFDHDLSQNRLSHTFAWTNGQNMIMTNEIVSSLDSLIDEMLGAEQENFIYGKGCTGAGNCLHYTQAMISNLTHMGCGHTHCVYPHGIQRFLTCNYIFSQYQSTYMTPWVTAKTAGSACAKTIDSNGLCNCTGTPICNYLTQYKDPNTCKCQKSVSKRSLEKRDIEERAIAAEKPFMAIPTGQLEKRSVGGDSIIAVPTGQLEGSKRKKRALKITPKNRKGGGKKN